MLKNQLFKTHPPEEFVINLLHFFGLNDFSDETEFTKIDLANINTIRNINNIKSELERYYLPCKSKIYLDNININRCITILRQFLKIYNYKLTSKERYVDNVKCNKYKLSKMNNEVKKEKIIINFE